MKVIVDSEKCLDIVQGADFEEFAVMFQQMQSNPDIEEVVIPADIDFELPFMENIFGLLVSEPVKRRAMARFQICYWATIDPKFYKPISLYGINSLDELRLISGLGCQVDRLYVLEAENYSYQQLEDIRFAAGER